MQIQLGVFCRGYSRDEAVSLAGWNFRAKKAFIVFIVFACKSSALEARFWQ